MKKLVYIHDGIALHPEWSLAEPVHFEMMDNEHIAILGRNGSGKTLLADMIAGRHPLKGDNPVYDFSSSTDPSRSTLASDNIAYVTFRDAYGGDTDRTYYLQQRWNQTEIDDEMPTVLQTLQRDALFTGQTLDTSFSPLTSHLPLNKPIVMLSSGELRKLHLFKALLRRPRLLIIDNPFIGLDAPSRTELVSLLTQLAQVSDLQMILVLTEPQDVPPFITHTVTLKDRRLTPKQAFTPQLKHPPRGLGGPLLSALSSQFSVNTSPIIRFNDVTIRYASKTILSHFSWTVCQGEHWAIQGPNGAGKSTLLSLICADNPQAYACDISLFGHRRGAGQSIWDIKQRIGYVSPEMHRSYQRNIPAIQVVASGLTDSIGFYRTLTDTQRRQCLHWMSIFRIDAFAERSFTHLSNGEQRLVLLARAFVKEPELLILDEPFHGLDQQNRDLAKKVITDYCRQEDKTLLMVSHYTDDFPSLIEHHLTLRPCS